MVDSILSSLGGGSGIDTKALVESLVKAERAPREFILDSKTKTLETQISGYGALRSAMSGIQDSMELLADSDTFNARNVAFADTTLVTPTSVDAGAATGEYTMNVTSLAAAHSLSLGGFTDADAAVGNGTLTFSFGDWDAGFTTLDTTNSDKASKTLTIDESNNTLNGIKDAINAADFGVQASIIDIGDGTYSLQITSESGASNEMKIAVSEGTPAGLAQLQFDETLQAMAEKSSGTDAAFTVNGLAVTRSSNTIDDVIEGLEFTLSGVSAGANDNMTIGIEADKSFGEQIVRDFVEAYNLFLEQAGNLTTPADVDEDAEDQTLGSLSRDPTTKTMINQVRSLISSTITGLDGNYTALATIGIQTQISGDLEINEDLFSDALDNNYSALTDIFSGTSSTSDARLGIVKTSASTAAGTYDVVVTTDPAKGYLAGGSISATDALDLNVLDTATGLFGTVLDTSTGDYSFQIKVDGTTSNIITLSGNYADVDAMIADMEAQINGDSNLSGVAAAVDISYDGTTGSFTTTSRTYGGASTIEFSSISADMDRFAFGGGATTAALTGVAAASVSGSLTTTAAIADSGVTDMGAQALWTTSAIDESLADLGGTQAVLNSSVITNGVSVGNFATATFDTSTDLFSGAFDLSSDGLGSSGGYTFDVVVEGNVASIDLTGSYTTTAELVADIQSQVNTGLAAISSSVVVAYDAAGDRFTFTSGREGTDSQVEIQNAAGSMGQLGIVNSGPVTGGADVETFVSAIDMTLGDYSLNLLIDGNAVAVNLDTLGSSVTDASAIATELSSQITGAAVTYDSVTNSFNIESDTGGTSSSVEITTVGADMAKLGFVAGPAVAGVENETFVNPLGTASATAGDYAMTVNVDGADVVIDLATIDVGHGAGVYQTADEIQGALDTAIPGASVAYDSANNRFSITSGTTGVSSTVDITAIGAGMAGLGFAVESGVDTFVGGLDTTGMSFTLTTDAGADNIVLGATYSTAEEVRAALQGMIVNSGVSVSYDADADSFSFTASTTGATSSVAISAATNTAALGIADDSDTGRDALAATAGVDVVGTIDGVAAFGSGNILLPKIGSELSGLSLEIAPGVTSATITIARGFGNEVKNVLDTFLESSGLIATRETRMNDQLSDIDTDRETLDRQMDARFSMLQNQFLAMEAIIRSLNGVSGQLDGLVDRLPFTAKS